MKPRLRADAEHWGWEVSRGRWVPVPQGHLEGGSSQTWLDTGWQCPVPLQVPGHTWSPVGVWDASGVDTAGEVGEGWSSKRGSSRAICPATSQEQGHRRHFHPCRQGWQQGDDAAVGGQWVRAVTFAWTSVGEAVVTSTLYFHPLLATWMPASREGGYRGRGAPGAGGLGQAVPSLQLRRHSAPGTSRTPWG